MKYIKSIKKSTWIYLALGAGVICAIMVGMFHAQQSRQRSELERNLILAQHKISLLNLDNLTAQKDQLTQEKALYTAQIADAKAKLAVPVDSIAAMDAIINSAYKCNLTIANISTSGEANGKLDGNKSTILPFSVQVEGNTKGIADFVDNIKTLFPTSVVNTYQFTINAPASTPIPTYTPSADTGSGNVTASPQASSADTNASIFIVIYYYQDDTHVE